MVKPVKYMHTSLSNQIAQIYKKVAAVTQFSVLDIVTHYCKSSLRTCEEGVQIQHVVPSACLAVKLLVPIHLCTQLWHQGMFDVMR